MAGNGYNSAWTLRGGKQRSESSWAASSKHLRVHTLQPLWPFPNIKRDGLCGRQFFGWICVVLGRQRYSTTYVSMSRIWQVAVKELYVNTEFMRLLGIQHRALLDKKLFFLRDLSQIGTWRRQSNASQGTISNISEKQLTKRDLAKRQRENKRTRHLGQVQDQDLGQAVVTKPWGQPSKQPTNRLISLAPGWEFCSRLVSSRDDVGGRSPTGGCSPFSGLVEVLGLGEGTKSGPWPIPGPR